mmetsp:Transcript_9769/g.18416  ORF Transcript_9769/g.18416 Transcript_9769/m.18416 type:complete len:183 (+) Transcript_9769:429-977(+)|eukprot:CAMPEP_0114227296 /NCGR_PEP_ID=MMETSP0058-20121206/1714_1 /TAXON_ID=36894 /ORGANISM="Pyramimonas parkeae, CCMP726" /LENGTH=182 /DNA_ID=CAMNT_0001338127 /DNA_START=429 /DNA_END=977 /DNA_ORIENTATION=+
MEAMNVENNRNPLYDAQYIQLLPGVGVQSSFEDETVNKTCKLLMQVAIITFVWQLLDVIRFVVVNPEVGAIVFVTIAVTFNSMLMWLAHGATTKKNATFRFCGCCCNTTWLDTYFGVVVFLLVLSIMDIVFACIRLGNGGRVAAAVVIILFSMVSTTLFCLSISLSTKLLGILRDPDFGVPA